jgi:hypothetical protein
MGSEQDEQIDLEVEKRRRSGKSEDRPYSRLSSVWFDMRSYKV